MNNILLDLGNVFKTPILIYIYILYFICLNVSKICMVFHCLKYNDVQ